MAQKKVVVKKILIIGIAGGLAKILCKLILKSYPGAKIVGVDSRAIKGIEAQENLELIRMKFRRGNFENLFRDHSFDTVFHLARISLSKNSATDLAKRLELSVMGTNRILQLSLKSNVKKIILLSSHHVYGASADNPVYLKESSALRAGVHHSELRDVVEMDQISESFMWKNKDAIQTVLFRPCNIIGKQLNNTMTRFLTGSASLKPIDYNPVFQFIHEFDMATVLLRSIDEVKTGTYNVAPSDFISLRKAVELTADTQIPIVMAVTGVLNKALKVFKMDIPPYFIDYLKYSCLIDNTAIREQLGDDFYRFSVEETLDLIR